MPRMKLSGLNTCCPLSSWGGVPAIPHPPNLPPTLQTAQACSYPTAKPYPSDVQARVVMGPGDESTLRQNIIE
jgi:hypothetical protein